MRVQKEVFEKAIEEQKILPYEEELIERLRDINYKGIPVSIIMFSRPMCNKACYSMSMNLTRGMDHFKLVHGDVNFLEKTSYPNHSWVEKDGYVYDTTDGFRWDKELYYKLFQPQVCEVYDEVTVNDYGDYQFVLSNANDNLSMKNKILLIQYIELLEQENPRVNKDYLFKEINLWRKKNNITKRFSDEEMGQYRKFLKDMEKSGKTS